MVKGARSCSWVETILSMKTGWEESGLRTALRRTWGWWWMKNAAGAECGITAWKGSCTPGGTDSSSVGSGEREGLFLSALISRDPAWSPVFSSGASSTRMWSC